MRERRRALERELTGTLSYGNKTERGHTSELHLTLGSLLDAEKELQKQLDEAVAQARSDNDDKPAVPSEKPKPKPKGRRDLSASDLPRVPLEKLHQHALLRAARWGSRSA